MTTTFKRVKNRVLTTIKAGSEINNTDDPVIFNVADPSEFPDPPFYITVERANDSEIYERMLVTSVDGDEFTATRAQDGSSKQSFSAGDFVMIRIIAAHIDEITTAINTLEGYIDQGVKTTDSPTFAGLTINTGLLQTTPGAGSDIKSIVNREYVDLAVTSLGASYYMTDDTDGDTGYKVCSLEPPTGSETYIEDTITAEAVISGAVWISKSGEEPAKLLRGIYGFFIEAEKISGTKGVRLYWKMYELKSDESTVLIGTSTYSNLIENDRSSYIIPLKLNNDYELSAGSRVYGEFWAIPEGTGSDPTIRIYYEGDTSSRWDVPANSEIFKNIFIPYTGATQDVDLGSHGLTVNDLTIGSLSGVLKASSGVVSGEATTDDLPEGSSHLYWTQIRFDNAFSAKSTDDLSEGSSNLYFSGKTQDDLPDGTTYKQYNPANVAITGGTINGIDVSNLLDKSANETITGKWTFDGFTDPIKLRFAYSSVASPEIHFLKARNTLSSPSLVANGDRMMTIWGAAYDGNSYQYVTAIKYVIDGTPSAGDVPTKIEFYTTPDGSVTPALALTLDSSQNAIFNGDIDLNSHKITNVANPTSDQDVATKKSSESRLTLYEMLSTNQHIYFSILETYDHIESYTSGSGSAPQDFGIASVRTGTTAGSCARQNLDWAGFNFSSSSGQAWISTRITNDISGNKVAFIGTAIDKFDENQNSSSYTGVHAGFFYEDGQWYASCGNGTAQTKTAITNLSAGPHILEMKKNASGYIEFYVDKNLETTITTNVPTSASYLQYFVHNKSEASSGRIYFYKFAYLANSEEG